MSENIPRDIMAAARKVGAARYEGSKWKHMRRYFEDGLYDDDPVVVAAVEAITAARAHPRPTEPAEQGEA